MRIFGLGPTELLIILAIVLLLFGPKQLPKLGRMFGKAMKDLREGVEGVTGDDADKAEGTEALSEADSTPAPEATKTEEKTV